MQRTFLNWRQFCSQRQFSFDIKKAVLRGSLINTLSYSVGKPKREMRLECQMRDTYSFSYCLANVLRNAMWTPSWAAGVALIYCCKMGQWMAALTKPQGRWVKNEWGVSVTALTALRGWAHLGRGSRSYVLLGDAYTDSCELWSFPGWKLCGLISTELLPKWSTKLNSLCTTVLIVGCFMPSQSGPSKVSQPYPAL